MAWGDTIQSLLWYLNIGAGMWLVYVLASKSLWSAYQFLGWYVATDVAQSVCQMAFTNGPRSAGLYPIFLFSGHTVKLVLAVFVIMDLCKLALKDHPALAQFSRRAAGYAMVTLGNS